MRVAPPASAASTARRSVDASASSRRRPARRAPAPARPAGPRSRRRAANAHRSGGSAPRAPPRPRPRPGDLHARPRGRAARPPAPPDSRRPSARPRPSRGDRAVCVHELDQAPEITRVGLRQHPVTEVEIWPGRPPTDSRIRNAAASTRSHGPSSSAGSRFPCTPRSAPTSSQAAVDGSRQSTPITSPPASAISSRRCVVPVPKWIVGTSTEASTCARSGATNSR